MRQIICPDKLNTKEWLHVVQSAHEIGLNTTSTLMFGHIEGPRAIARHLVRLRGLQARTGGFTEFVPLPFVHSQAPMFLKVRSSTLLFCIMTLNSETELYILDF